MEVRDVFATSYFVMILLTFSFDVIMIPIYFYYRNRYGKYDNPYKYRWLMSISCFIGSALTGVSIFRDLMRDVTPDMVVESLKILKNISVYMIMGIVWLNMSVMPFIYFPIYGKRYTKGIYKGFFIASVILAVVGYILLVVLL